MPALFSIQAPGNSDPKNEALGTVSLDADEVLDIEKGASTNATINVETSNQQITSMSASQSTFVQQLEDGLPTDQTRQDKSNTSPKNQSSVTSSPASSYHSSSLHVSGDVVHVLPSLTTNGQSKLILIALIVLLGAAASVAFMSFGFHTTNKDMQGRFESQAQSITYHILNAWTTYETFALWIHQACHKHVERDYSVDPYEDIASHLGYCSRSEFRRLYEYIASQGADFLSAQLLRVITNDVRDALEKESREYYNANYPNVNYRGITEQAFRPDGGFDLVYREQAEYYMPIHYVEPVEGNEVIIDLDKMAAQGVNNVIECMETFKPVLTPRLKLVQETDHDAYGVILAHPGIQTSQENVTRTNSVAQVVVRLPSFLHYALQSASVAKDVYLYDTTGEKPQFLGGMKVNPRHYEEEIYHEQDNHYHVDDSQHHPPESRHTELPEVDLWNIPRPRSSRSFERELGIAGRKWTIVVVSEAYQADMLFVVVGGTIIFAASLLCAAWFHSHLRRIAKLNKIKHAQAVEKAEIAKAQATRERELNEFMAHEIRNPLSSAISCLTFVGSAVSEHVPNNEAKESILEDVSIMDASLQFINELLRNMLDIHRARGRQIKLQLSPVDIRRDIMEPVAAILFMRGAKVSIEVDCPPDLGVMGDRMRLKQIALNLSANATKFCLKGYIRLKAEVVDGSVEISVSDSGPGIPPEKRNRLFAKFQESLDSLNQGTGIGLCVCKTLSELMGADINLDDKFDSGIEGCPGTRFVLRLNQPPLELEKNLEHNDEENGHEPVPPTQHSQVSNNASAAKTMNAADDNPSTALPEALSILLVDDDTMIRKMFRRAALRVAPTWEIDEACNGETAVMITQTRKFDVIFLDQYMASVEKQMLGTEACRALRSKGVHSIICGLSANDMQEQFLDSGANTFMMKPFPCKKDAMARAFQEVLESGNFYDKGRAKGGEEKKEL